MTTEEKFNVVQFLDCDFTEYVGCDLGINEAIELAHSYTTRPAARLGIIQRVMITDSGDNCCFDWQFGKGIVFPPRSKTA